MSLEEWIEKMGLGRLREQWLCHFDVYGHSKEESEELARLCMISLRSEEQQRKD